MYSSIALAVAVVGKMLLRQQKTATEPKKNRSEQHFGSFVIEEEQTVTAKVIVPLNTKIAINLAMRNEFKRRKETNDRCCCYCFILHCFLLFFFVEAKGLP